MNLISEKFKVYTKQSNLRDAGLGLFCATGKKLICPDVQYSVLSTGVFSLYVIICNNGSLTDLPSGHCIPFFGAVGVHKVGEHAPDIPLKIFTEFEESKNKLLCMQHQPIHCATGAGVS